MHCPTSARVARIFVRGQPGGHCGQNYVRRLTAVARSDLHDPHPGAVRRNALDVRPNDALAVDRQRADQRCVADLRAAQDLVPNFAQPVVRQRVAHAQAHAQAWAHAVHVLADFLDAV